MQPDKTQSLVVTYLIPVLVAVLLAGIGYVYGLLKIESIVFSVTLAISIGLAIFLSELWLSKTIRLRERSASFEFLTKVLFSARNLATRDHLSLEDVVALERTAREVWVYAYNMKWESHDSDLTRAVLDNLTAGIKYRYVVPNRLPELTRVRSISNRYSEIENHKELIQFRVRENELRLVQFGITIYNPDVELPTSERRGQCVVVFFPHYEGLTDLAPSTRTFLSIRGPATVEIELAFMESWQRSMSIDLSTAQQSEYSGAVDA